MINTSELRIGNVFQGAFGAINLVFSINETVVNESVTGPLPGGGYTRNAGSEEEDIYPIPITPEWLERFGFIKDQHSRNRYIKGVYTIIIGSGGVDNAFCLINTGILSYPKYLHQLQNLYFALTGEELIINETA